MTIAFNDAYTQYTGTGVRTFFEYGFPILPGSQVYVLVDGLPVLINQQTTGIVFDDAPILNATIEIFRLTDVTQLRDFEAFEAFPAAKTEDAVDKLIMLKQEGWFRAAMNLFADPRLDRVILVNDKGNDAHILIWNEHTQESLIINDAGVFAGLVTQNMPCPGAVVEKPDHFAYFQYGEAGSVQVLTTTLYPAEATDAMELAISLIDGLMEPIPEENAVFNFAALDGIITQILSSTGPHDENAEFNFAALDGTIETILLSTGPHDEAASFNFAALDGTVEEKLVEALMPDEAMDITIALIDGSMTPV
jgi:hypothetical protein